MSDGSSPPPFTRASMGMFETRASMTRCQLPDQSANVKELKDKFTELGLSFHQPLSPHLLNNVEKKLGAGVCINDLPAGITDEDLKYLHNKGQQAEEDDGLASSRSVDGGVSPCYTKAESLDADYLLDDVTPEATPQNKMEEAQPTESSAPVEAFGPQPHPNTEGLIDGSSCGSVKDLCKRFNDEPPVMEDWMEDGKVKQSILAVIQVASSVAMSCGLDEALEVREALLEDPWRCRPSGTLPSPQVDDGTGEQAVGALPDISNCQVSVRSLREMFDQKGEEEPMEICTRL